MTPFDNAALVLAAAALLVWLLHRLGQSSIVAYLLLGVAAGPYAFDRVPSGAVVTQLADVGVVLLLFFIGLEFDVRRLKRMARLATLGAAAQLLATTLPLAALARLLGIGWVEGLALGFCLAVSSTTIAMQVFEERREADSHVAIECVALSIGQDLAAMAVLALSAVLFGPGTLGGEGGGASAHGGASSWQLLYLLGLPVVFALARFALPRLFQKIALAAHSEAFALASLAACFVVAALANQLGASLALGAFLAGMVFADTPLEPQIRADLATIKRLTLGLFFVSIGMLVDLAAVARHWPLLLAATVVVVVVKTAAAALTLRALGRPWSSAAGTGLALAPISEFAFVLASSAGGRALFSAETQALLVPLVVVSMLPAPLQVAWSIRFGRWFAHWKSGADEKRVAVRRARREAVAPPAAPAAPPALAIVVGYGPVGRTLCRILLRMGLRVVVIDYNHATVERLRSLGRAAVFGDAAQRDVLRAAQIEEAKWLVVTLPDAASRVAIVATARAVKPRLNIVVRARYLEEKGTLERVGADSIAYEEAEVAVELAHLLLKQLHAAPALLEAEVASIRSEIAVRTGFSLVLPAAEKVAAVPAATPPSGPSSAPPTNGGDATPPPRREPPSPAN
ncbi:MAG: cation:proton antiporter [Planctomycetes bacterium]|nr:cation:proton antiporter [Planctomycetota bacterium]